MKPQFILFLEDLAASIMTSIKIFFLSRLYPHKPPRLKPNESAVLLGNGPSLKGFLADHPAFLKGKAIFCVNYFVRTVEFENIKPQYYVLVAPDFWQKEEKHGWKEERYKIFEALAEKTKWKMKLFVPTLAKKHQEWQNIIKKNNYIEVYFVNITPIEGFTILNHFYFKKWLGMPRPHNVLVATLFIALNMRFSKIYIAGADHSWMKEIVVGDNNRVFLSQKHFYDSQLNPDAHYQNKPDAKPMYIGTTKKERRLHEILHKFYYSFRSYWELKEYARHLGTQVYNITEGSYIDAFDRLKI